MKEQKLLIKNMVCPRCIRVVREDLEAMGIPVREVALGEVMFSRLLSPEQMQAVERVLRKSGFEVLNTREEQLVEQVRHLVIQHVRDKEKKPSRQNFSDYLSSQTQTSYPVLSRLFSSLTGITIEQYIIQTKIERVKELLIYDQKTLSEIAWDLEYSSSQHLSGQFKKVTGLTPTEFRELHASRRHVHEAHV
jgi:AraC family transcriptional regulator